MYTYTQKGRHTEGPESEREEFRYWQVFCIQPKLNSIGTLSQVLAGILHTT